MSEKDLDKFSQFGGSSNDGGETEGVIQAFAPTTSRFGVRFQMGVLVIAGATMMLIHHSLYSFLDGKPVFPLDFSPGVQDLNSQLLVSTLGNAIAYVARVFFSAAIGIASIQVLWMQLRRRPYSIAQVDALVACKSTPFAFSAVTTWYHTFLLAVLGSMAALMAFLSIVTPGSLQVVTSDFSVPADCTVPTVSLATSNLLNGNGPEDSSDPFTVQPRVIQLAAQVIMNGAPLVPLNPCSFPCRYDITFDAPSASCTPVNSSFDFGIILPPPLNSSSPLRVWSASKGQFGAQVTAAMRDLELNETAVNCLTYNSTYHVTVTQDITGSSPTSFNVFEVEPHGLTFDGQTTRDTVQEQYDAVTSAFGNMLAGVVDLAPNEGGIFSSDNILVGYSPTFGGRTNHPWDPSTDIGTAISSFMQNISLSLLSNILIEEGNSTTTMVDTTCFYSVPTYQYDRVQLLTAYGIALFVSIVCTLLGIRAVHQNGVEESFSFSRIAGAVLNKSFFERRYELTSASQLTADGGPGGQFRLAHNTVW